MTQIHIKVDRSVVANRPITGGGFRPVRLIKAQRSIKADQHKGIKKAYYILVGIAAPPVNFWAINSWLKGAGRCVYACEDTESQR